MSLPERVDAYPFFIYRGNGFNWRIELYSDEAFTMPIPPSDYGDSFKAAGVQGTYRVEFEVNADDTGWLLYLDEEATAAVPAFVDLLDYDLLAIRTVGDDLTICQGAVPVQGRVTTPDG